MRVLLTVHQFFPEFSSGTEVLTLSVARRLRELGHDVEIFTGFPAEKELPAEGRLDRYEFEGFKVHRFHHAFLRQAEQRAVTETEYNHLLAARFFAGLVEDFPPDVVHFFHFGRLGVGLIDVCSAGGFRAFYTPTDFWAVCPTSQMMLPDGTACDGATASGANCVRHVAMLTQGRQVRRVMERTPDWLAGAGILALRAGLARWSSRGPEVLALTGRRSFIVRRLNALSGIASPTMLMTRQLRSAGVTNPRLQQAAYGIDVGRFSQYRHVRRRDQAHLSIGFVGTLAHHKGAHILVQAIRRLEERDVALSIYGREQDFPDYSSSLRAIAADDTRIRFQGSFPNSEVAKVFASLDVLVVPSLWFENAPLVISSALASGVPVVASDFEGMSEVIEHGRNGLLFPPGSAESLAEALRRLCHEPTLLERLSQGCEMPKSVEAYTDELVALWGSAAPCQGFDGRQRVEPLRFRSDSGLLGGWACVDYRSPMRVSLEAHGRELAGTSVFSDRRDVRDALRASGAPVRDEAFGFALPMPGPFAAGGAELVVWGAGGTPHRTLLAKCQPGGSFFASPTCLVGIDVKDWSTLGTVPTPVDRPEVAESKGLQ
jgi:glycosyltransferase involved in cell wall biosynthesis